MQHNASVTTQGIERMELPASEYSKSKVGLSEISVKGKLYDVKSVSFISSNTVQLLLLYDMCEEDIVDEIVKTVRKSSPQDKKSQQPLITLLTLDYILPASFYTVPLCGSVVKQYNLFCGSLLSKGIDVKSPPPEVA